MHVDPSQASAGQLSLRYKAQDFLMCGNRHRWQRVQQTQQLLTISKRATGELAGHELMAADTAFIE